MTAPAAAMQVAKQAGLLTRIFNTPASTSVPARCLLAVPACLILKKFMGKKKKKSKKMTGSAQVLAAALAKKKEAEGGNRADAGLDKKAKKAAAAAAAKGGIKAIWATLWPKWFKPGVQGIGSTEMVALFSINMVRVYVNVLLANMVRLGDGLLYTRDWGLYRAFVVYAVKLGIGRILLQQIYEQFRDSLARKWRTKLTAVLHDEYFASSNYYHVETEMRDADLRITEDVKQLAEGFSQFFSAATYTATIGGFYSLKVFWEFGFLYMSAPFIYGAFASKMQPILGKMNWALFTQLEGAKAKFRTAQTRLLEHSEAIAALRGQETEAGILNGLFANVITQKKRVFKSLIRYEASRSLLYEHLLLTMYTTFIIGPGTFRPLVKETVATLAELRAAAGYQFILFIQLMTSVASLVRIFDGYKKLTGNAVRFVELREKLKKIAAREVSTEAVSIKEGDSIKFENVMVWTPTDNKLVHDLSFEVGKSDSMLLTGHNVLPFSSPPPPPLSRSLSETFLPRCAGRREVFCV